MVQDFRIANKKYLNLIYLLIFEDLKASNSHRLIVIFILKVHSTYF